MQSAPAALTAANKQSSKLTKINANAIINEEMTLEEKLAAIDQAMANAQAQANEEAAARGTSAAPIDPASLTICDGCE